MRLCRVGNEGADPRLHVGQAAADAGRAGSHGTGEIARQRVVATGIEEDDVGLAFALELHLPQHEVQGHGLEIEVALVYELGIDRNEVIAAGDLEAVPCVEQQADVGLSQDSRKIAHLEIEAALVEIEAEDHLEPQVREDGAHVLGVVGGVGQGGGMAVGRVAHHERGALLRAGGQRRKHEGSEKAGAKEDRARAAATRHGQAPFSTPAHAPQQAISTIRGHCRLTRAVGRLVAAAGT